MDPKHRILQPIRPTKGVWIQWEVSGALEQQCYAVERYYNQALEVQVITAIEALEQPDRSTRFEYHISVTGCRAQTHRVYRCSDQTAKCALEMFGFTNYAEDNHVPGGLARNYWRPVVETQDPGCECFDTEPKIIEDKGDYIWRHAPD